MNQKGTNRLAKLVVYLVNKLWLLLASFIILMALVFTLLRLTLPYTNYYKAEIVDWFESQFQIDITVDRIDADWSESGPVISVTNLQLKSNDGQLTFNSSKSVSVHLDGLSSLLSWQVITDNIDVDGAELNFILDRQLALKLDTRAASPTDTTEVSEASKLLLSTLFGQKRLSLKNSRIILETLSGKTFRYYLKQVNIRNYDDIHQISGQLSDEFNGQLNLVTELYGDPLLDESYTQLYIEGKGVELSKLPIFENAKVFKPQSGKLDWRLWSEWKNDHWTSAVGDFHINQVSWSYSDNSEELPGKQADNEAESEKALNAKKQIALENFTANFSWFAPTVDAGTAKISDIQLDRKPTSSTHLPDILFAYSAQESHSLQWDVLLQNWQLESDEKLLSQFLDMFDLSLDTELPSLSAVIDSLSFRGERELFKWVQPVAYMEVSNLSSAAIPGVPDFSDLSAEISLGQKAGQMRITSSDSKIRFRDLFRNPLAYQQLNLAVDWLMREDEAPEVRIKKFELQNEDLKIDAKARFFTQDESPHMSLWVELTDVDVSKKSLYLPTGIMTPSLVSYLDESVEKGRLDRVKAAVRGPLSQFPYTDYSGVFIILGELADTDFKYLPGWPKATKLNARLLFERNGMDILANSAEAMGNRVNQARAIINDFGSPGTPLKLTLDVTSKNNQGITFLSKSPLVGVAKSLSDFNLQGDFKSQIKLTVGLDDDSLFNMQGKVRPNIKSSKVSVGKIEIAQIEGDINFDHNGLAPAKLSARFHGEPLNIKIKKLSAKEEKQDISLAIDVKGTVNQKAIDTMIGQQWSPLYQGKAPFEAAVIAREERKQPIVEVDFRSSLKGIQLNLPEGFSKTKSEKTPFNYQLSMRPNRSVATLSWNDTVKGTWQWREGSKSSQFSGARFLINSDDALSASLSPQISVSGNIQKIRLNEWLETLETLKLDKLKDEVTINTAVNVKLNIGELSSDWLTLPKVELAAHFSENSRLLIGIHSENGSLLSRIQKGAPWEVELNDIDLNFDQENSSSQSDTTIAAQTVESPLVDPQSWPELDLSCDNCKLQNKNLGNVLLKLRHTHTGLNLSGELSEPGKHQLIASLDWSTDKAVNSSQLNHHTSIDFQLASDNFGQLMAEWLQPTGIEESSAQIAGRAKWQGLPWKVEPTKIQGDVNFNLGTGYLSEVSDAKARLFSLFNLQSLSRRLRLDFKDVYKKGFFYKRLTGDVSLYDGIVSTDNVYVDGNAAKVSLSGSVDLENETIEQYALVVPQLTSSLPVLVGWAVEPTTGVLMYLLNKLMEPAIEVVTQIEYRIHGKLDDIQVDEIKKLKSKVEYEKPKEPEKPAEENKPADNDDRDSSSQD